MKSIDEYKLIKRLENSIKEALEHFNTDEYDEIDYVFELDTLDLKNLNFLSKCPLKAIAACSGYGSPFYINEKQEIIYEPVNRTYSIEEVAERAKTKLGLDPGCIKGIVAENSINTCLLVLNEFDNIDFVIKVMHTFGWSFAKSFNANYKGFNLTYLSFDPIFQDAVNDEIEKCSLLSHWTPAYNYKSICKYGLIPKSDNKKFHYPPKVHLLKASLSFTDKMKLGERLCIENDDIKNNGDYILLDVDCSKLLKSIDFFYDPRYDGGYYVKTSIPKEVISKNYETNFLNN